MLELLGQYDDRAKEFPLTCRYWSFLSVELFNTSIQYLGKKKARPGVEIRTSDTVDIQRYWSLGQTAIESLGMQVLPVPDLNGNTIRLNPESSEDGNSTLLEEFFPQLDYRNYLPFPGEAEGFPILTRKLFRRGFLLSDGIRADDGSKRIELSGLVFPVYRPESNHTSLVIVSGEDFVSSEDSEALNRLIFRCIALGNNISSHFFHDITLVYLEPKKRTFTSSEVYRF